MKRLLKIRNKPGRKTLRIVSVNDMDVGTLPQSVLFQYAGKNEHEVICNDHKIELMLESVYKYTLGRILNYLTRQDRSEIECRRYLKQFYISEDMTDKIIDKLKSYNYLNDARYAESIAISASSRGLSRKELAFKMRERGLNEAIATEAIDKYYNDKEADEKLYRKIQKTADRYSSLPYCKLKEKVLAKFYKKGFSLDKISCLLEKYSTEKDN
ncbi:MAG: hypothetical protein CSB55_05930 [Candidatus Cloacimonadota bacterium]|nr:MAG: hypothetical protein CSB55_05930 [Candidatus Cloacimonadota bacterium]